MKRAVVDVWELMITRVALMMLQIQNLLVRYLVTVPAVDAKSEYVVYETEDVVI